MVTMVGMQSNFGEAIKELLELEYDAEEAYAAALTRLDNADYRAKLSEFAADHRRHIKDLSELLKDHHEEAPTGPSSKQWLTKGKVVMANLIGDNAILAAMQSNEVDTNTAYERLYGRSDKWQDAEEIIKRGFDDEKKHKSWLDQTIKEQGIL